MRRWMTATSAALAWRIIMIAVIIGILEGLVAPDGGRLAAMPLELERQLFEGLVAQRPLGLREKRLLFLVHVLEKLVFETLVGRAPRAPAGFARLLFHLARESVDLRVLHVQTLVGGRVD